MNDINITNIIKESLREEYSDNSITLNKTHLAQIIVSVMKRDSIVKKRVEQILVDLTNLDSYESYDELISVISKFGDEEFERVLSKLTIK